MEPTPKQTPTPPQDLSPRVVELARAIDRLPPGQYEIQLQKPEVRAQEWSVEVVRLEKLSTMRLRKHSPME